MTDAQKSVLEALKSRDTTTLAELVEITGKSKSNVSNLLNKLIQMNLATKEAYGIYKIKDYNPQGSLHMPPLREPDSEPREPDNEPRELIEHLQQEMEYMKSRVEFLEKALDQSQQLQAFSQKTIESQRLQLEESQRPKPLMARLKAVFVAE